MALPEIKVTLKNVKKTDDFLDYYIVPSNSELATDWVNALKELLMSKNPIEKNYCFIGFPGGHRTVEYLCEKLNEYVFTINMFNTTGIWQDAGLEPYVIEEHFTPDVVRFSDKYPVGNAVNGDESKTLGLRLKHEAMNQLHLHFERLQGQVWRMSDYYRLADYPTKFAIRQLNNICHELEGRVLGDRKFAYQPEWSRPSQITTFLHAKRYELTNEHRKGFAENGYDREFGGVYMHWTQIGKTLFEVWRDEGAPPLEVGDDTTDITANDGTTSEAINSLKFYSGEFDVEWAKTIRYGDYPWYDDNMDNYYNWLTKYGVDISDPRLSLGYLKIGQVDLEKSFGMTDEQMIWKVMEDYQDICAIEVDGVWCEYPDNWADPDADEKQIEYMKAGYDHSSRGG